MTQVVLLSIIDESGKDHGLFPLAHSSFDDDDIDGQPLPIPLPGDEIEIPGLGEDVGPERFVVLRRRYAAGCYSRPAGVAEREQIEISTVTAALICRRESEL